MYQHTYIHTYTYAYILSNLKLTIAQPEHDAFCYHPTSQVYSQEGPRGVCGIHARLCRCGSIYSFAGWMPIITILWWPCRLVEGKVWRRQCGMRCWKYTIGISRESFWQTDWATGDQVSKHSVCWWFVAWDAAQLQMLRMLVSPEAYNFSSFDSKSLLCARASKLKQQICKLIYTYNMGIRSACQKDFSLILYSSVGLSAGIRSACQKVCHMFIDPR